MKRILKLILLKYVPLAYYLIVGLKKYVYCHTTFRKLQNVFEDAVYQSGNITVLTGPFCGLKYFNKTVWGSITPKWIGSYEEELHDVIRRIIASNYSTIVDVGAAEGYYAVGLSKMCNSSVVYSFDVDPFARWRQSQLASINEVKNLTIGGYCSLERLSAILGPHSVLICDIEGFEYSLLNSEKCHQLMRTDLLVEVHSFESRSSTEVMNILSERFSCSHTISFIPATERQPTHYLEIEPRLQTLDELTLTQSLAERGSGSIGWLWMVAKQFSHTK